MTDTPARNPLQILLVEDDPGDQELTRRVLAEGKARTLQSLEICWFVAGQSLRGG